MNARLEVRRVQYIFRQWPVSSGTQQIRPPSSIRQIRSPALQLYSWTLLAVVDWFCPERTVKQPATRIWPPLPFCHSEVYRKPLYTNRGKDCNRSILDLLELPKHFPIFNSCVARNVLQNWLPPVLITMVPRLSAYYYLATHPSPRPWPTSTIFMITSTCLQALQPATRSDNILLTVAPPPVQASSKVSSFSVLKFFKTHVVLLPLRPSLNATSIENIEFVFC